MADDEQPDVIDDGEPELPGDLQPDLPDAGDRPPEGAAATRAVRPVGRPSRDKLDRQSTEKAMALELARLAGISPRLLLDPDAAPGRGPLRAVPAEGATAGEDGPPGEDDGGAGDGAPG